MRFIGKCICAIILVTGSVNAFAQSSDVTLYGVVDTFIQYLNNGGMHSFSERSGGNTASLFGLKGSEALGGGLRAIFDLESGFNVNNGAFFVDSTALFYRQAWLGLADDRYGSLTFGRQYEPSFWVVYYGEPFRGNEALSPLGVSVATVDRRTLATQVPTGRASNAIVYQSPNLSGFKLYAMYGFSSTTTQPVPTTNGNVFDVAAMYTGYGLYAGIGYQNQHAGKQTLPGLSAALNRLGTENFTGALAYRLGIVNFQFNYMYSRPQDAPAGSMAALLGAGHSFSALELGATIQASSADTIEIAGIERSVRGAHDSTQGIEVGFDHNLSKRTTLYARAGYMKNHGSATSSWPGVSVTAPGTSQTMMALGLSHRF